MSARQLFPAAHVLTASALIFEGDGRPALYLAANTRDFQQRLYRVPEDACVTLEGLRPLPALAQESRGHPMRSSRAVFESPTGRAVLHVNAGRAARELIEALEALSSARTARQRAAQVFEPTP